MRRLIRTLELLRAKDLPILILGETGSGKEFVARIIHDDSRRARAPFQIVDCAAMPEGLLEVELFGARAGAFTDLAQDREGILRHADGGTVFVDEVAFAPLAVQAKLLRAVSNRSFRPVGSDSEVTADVRFLFSSARDLERETREGRFRADLFHRINVIRITVPPLRKRIEDLPELLSLLLEDAASERGKAHTPVPRLELEAIERLQDWPWPGNVRELRNLLARLLLEGPARIRKADIDRLLFESEQTTTIFPHSLLAREGLRSLKELLERDYIVYHLRRLHGDTGALMNFLGMSRRQFYRRSAHLGILLREEKRRGE